MTKKSYARQMRDKQTKELKDTPNSCWDDLTTIYNDCVLLLSQHANLADCLRNQELIAEVADRQQLVSNIKILASDLSTLRNELTSLHELHSGKSGGTTDPDEVINSIGIFEQYNLFMEKHQAVVMPTVHFIIEQISSAEKSLIEKKKALQELTSNTVVSENTVIHPPKEQSLADIDTKATEQLASTLKQQLQTTEN